MAAAAFIIRDGDMLGTDITILEESAVIGGSPDGSGSPEEGYVLRGGRMIESKYLCTFAPPVYQGEFDPRCCSRRSLPFTIWGRSLRLAQRDDVVSAMRDRTLSSASTQRQPCPCRWPERQSAPRGAMNSGPVKALR